MLTRDTAKPRFDTMQRELKFAEPVERLMADMADVNEERRRRTMMRICALWSIVIVVEIALLFLAIWMSGIY